MNISLGTRLALVALAALLALPAALAASPTAAKGRTRTITRTSANPAPIVISNHAVDLVVRAAPYPSQIAVRGLRRARIRDVDVRLVGLTHTGPDDIHVLLVGPRGQTAIVMADVGGYNDVEEVTLRLDDEAAAPLPDQSALTSGRFRPTDADGAVEFLSPAPTTSPNAALSVFDGTDPNGTWRLFVQDENGIFDKGPIAGGWSLELKVKVKGKKRR